jgi:hypothetical protein
MNSRVIDRRIVVGLLLVVVIAAISSVAGQDPKVQDQLPAPPPMRSIPETERNQINEIRESKTRIKRTIELADGHLQRAEAAATQQHFDLSLRELGMYLALIENGFSFLAELNADRGKSRDLYKHLEMALRAHGPRLTVMRRATPLEYAMRMKEVEDFAREQRTDALNAFYGHTVVREARKKNAEDDKPKATPSPER